MELKYARESVGRLEKDLEGVNRRVREQRDVQMLKEVVKSERSRVESGLREILRIYAETGEYVSPREGYGSSKSSEMVQEVVNDMLQAMQESDDEYRRATGKSLGNTRDDYDSSVYSKLGGISTLASARLNKHQSKPHKFQLSAPVSSELANPVDSYQSALQSTAKHRYDTGFKDSEFSPGSGTELYNVYRNEASREAKYIRNQRQI